MSAREPRGDAPEAGEPDGDAFDLDRDPEAEAEAGTEPQPDREPDSEPDREPDRADARVRGAGRGGGPPPLRPSWEGRAGEGGGPPGAGGSATAPARARAGAAGAGAGREASGAVAAASAAGPEPFAERFIDRLNPVLVRELRQSVRSRGFLVALGLVLFAIGLVAVLLAANIQSLREGEAFGRALQAMLFATALVIPFRALGSVGREVEGALSEHILLTRLSPGRIVDGHIFAACAQLLIVGSLFAPLLALTYLLRGVDVGTVTMGLGFAFTTALGLTAGAAAAGSLGRTPAVRALGKVAGAIGIVWAAFGLMVVLEGALRFGRFGRVAWSEVIGLWVVPVALWIALCRLVAKAMLSHPFEDRSFGFRVHALVTSATLFAVVVLLKGTGGGPSPDELALIAIGIAIPTWLMSATEEDGLSPLVGARLRGKPTPLLFLGAPLLPGGSRGLAFALIHGALLVAAARRLPELVGGRRPTEAELGVVALFACYGLLYAAAGRLLRRAFGGGPAKSWTARAVLLGIFVAGMALPAIVDVIDGGSSSWHVGHILNPIYTIDRHDREPWTMVAVVGGIGAALAVVNTGGFARALTELGGAAAGRPPARTSGRHAGA